MRNGSKIIEKAKECECWGEKKKKKKGGEACERSMECRGLES